MDCHMLECGDAYNDGIKEIEEYFSFVELIVDDGTKLSVNHTNSSKPVELLPVSDTVHKVLVANGFLLIYNLVEATLRNLILEVYKTIKSHNLQVSQLSVQIKSIWVKQQIYSIRSLSTSDTVKKKVQEIVDKVLNQSPIELESSILGFSGNLDANKIRTIAKEYGWKVKSVKADALLEVKNKRNRLAHGEHTFSQVGKDYTIQEVIAFFSEAKNFLNEVIKAVDLFITNNEYQAKL